MPDRDAGDRHRGGEDASVQHPEHEHEHHVHTPILYPDAIAQFRADKDQFFREADGSPVPQEQRAAFGGLPYYPVDEDLRFEDLELLPYEGNEPVRFEIPTSDGQLRPAQRAGIFRFRLADHDATLTAYTFAEGESESLFVPFLDATSGTETYGAGRYLDLYPEEDGTWSIDFNLAYHPSCVYDPRFSCPLTPPENRLPVPIRGGERLPPDAP